MGSRSRGLAGAAWEGKAALAAEVAWELLELRQRCVRSLPLNQEKFSVDSERRCLLMTPRSWSQLELAFCM